MVKADDHEALASFGIHDVELTEDDLTALVAELGLGEADAGDLVRGLSGNDSKPTPTIKVEEPEEEVKKSEDKPEKAEPVAKEPETEVKDEKKDEKKDAKDDKKDDAEKSAAPAEEKVEEA